ncbi:hypothetical protein ACFOZY_14445 [Chungangia koreensis]|uniref:Thymidylate kinase n=1 Tax=Chungangia koreensis TaxID=752657 RepID=A0ABV8X9C8_9LACT
MRKLILVEGLPGSGKTTTAQLIADQYKEKDYDVRLFLEGNTRHPADYDAVSYFTSKEFEHFIGQYSSLARQIEQHAEERPDGMIVRWAHLKQDIGDQFELVRDELLPRDIYELPLDLHMELMVDSYERFVDQAMVEDALYIFECCFIQNPVTIGLIKYDATEEVITSYVERLAKIIERLDPLLIYVEQDDIRKSFTKAFHERPKEWAEGFVNYYNNQGYGKTIGAEGYEGTLSVLQTRSDLENRIFEQLPMEKLRINNSAFNMNGIKETLKKILD